MLFTKQIIKSPIIKNKFVFWYLRNDKYVGQRIALDKYEPYETKLINRQIKSDDVVIDVGANIGYYTVILANKAKKVYAFEPDPLNFSILEKNIKANKLKNVIAIQAAVSDKNGTSFLYKSPDNFGDHRIYKTPLGFATSPLEEREKVKVIKLDGFIKEKVDLIKIDTQGYEPKVIEGAKKIIEKDKPIIFFEYWPEGYREAKLDPKNMMKFLEKVYKKIFYINDELNVYGVKNKKEIEKICVSNKTGYADLWVKEKLTIGDNLNKFKNIRIKKVIKKLLNINK